MNALLRSFYALSVVLSLIQSYPSFHVFTGSSSTSCDGRYLEIPVDFRKYGKERVTYYIRSAAFVPLSEFCFMLIQRYSDMTTVV